MDVDSELQALKALAREALERAADLGATQAEVGVSRESGLSATVRLGEVETLEHQRDRALGVTVYVHGCKGSASTADFSSSALAETVDKACSIARFTAHDEFAGLADPALLATSAPELGLHHPWSLTPDQAMELALRCETAARGADERICNSEGATLHTGEGVRVYANSHGFCEGYASSHHSLSCAVLARDGGGMERDFWYSADRDWHRLDDAEAIGLEAARRTVHRLGARQLGTREVPVLYSPELARGLIGHFVSAVRGSAQYRQATYLLGAAGSQVFPSWMNVVEQPHLRGAIGSAPYDNEGVALRERDLVRDGVVQGYVLSSYSARKLGLQTTGNAGGVHNLTVAPSAGGRDEMLATMGTGLLVTELMGQGVNPVTGDYSRGAAGYWVENGAVVHPVSEITIAGNLLEMFRNLVAAGSDVDSRGVIRCGGLLVERMTVAGN